MDEFKNRLLQFLESLGLSQRAFEESCGITQGTIPSIKVKGPSVDVLMKISNTYPDLNLNWLIAGRGPMLIQDQPAPSPQNDIHHNQVFIANWGELRGVIEDVIARNK